MNVEIQDLKPMRVAYMRAEGPYQETLPALWSQFSERAMQLGLFKPGVKMLSVCHDDPRVTPPEKIRGDACVTVGDDFTGDDTIKVQTIAGGPYAKTVHRGAYSGLGATWNKLLDEGIPASGRSIRKGLPSFEIYVNNPQNTAEADLITELYQPLN